MESSAADLLWRNVERDRAQVDSYELICAGNDEKQTYKHHALCRIWLINNQKNIHQ